MTVFGGEEDMIGSGGGDERGIGGVVVTEAGGVEEDNVSFVGGGDVGELVIVMW